jgi:acyl-CoA synthetase (AMP-forming)/AMP-acid ligase II
VAGAGVIVARIRAAARGRDAALAIANEQGALSFGALLDAVDARAAELRAAGASFAILALPGGPAFTLWQLAAMQAGCVVAPLPSGATEHELRAYLDGLAPQFAVADPDDAARLRAVAGAGLPVFGPEDPLPALAPIEHPFPAEVRLVQFTSGSTARPKGILLTERNLEADLDAQRAHLAQFAGRSVFCPLPQFHAMGNAVVLEHLGHGSGVVLSNRFAPAEDFARIRGAGCDHLLCSPSWVRLWLPLARIGGAGIAPRGLTLGTAAIDPELVASLQAVWPRATLHLRYGLSEAAGALTRLDLAPGEPLAAAGLVGAPVPGVELRAPAREPEPARELVVRCAMAASHQWHEQRVIPLLDEDGWLATGDYARLDGGGRLRLEGRASSFVKIQGFRVSPFEIEALLRAAPGVRDAVVVGTPDRTRETRLVAFVEPDGAALDPAALRAHCEAKLAAYKVPARFAVVPELPRTPAGKPDRPRLTDMADR